MENPIAISLLNDFIFCPASIYFHSIDDTKNSILTKEIRQISGTHAHKKVDEGEYSTRKDILQGVFVYSSEYNLIGKIDTFDIQKGLLTERKKKIRVVYDGYVFQLYAQYFALVEMGYNVKELRLYSMEDNRVHVVRLPTKNSQMLDKFRKLIFDIENFDIENYSQKNKEKCENCIYEELCYFSAIKE